jgi:hypothetical protein
MGNGTTKRTGLLYMLSWVFISDTFRKIEKRSNGYEN